MHIRFRQNEKILQRKHTSLALGLEKFHLRVKSQERGGWGRGMDNGAAVVAKNGVVAIVARKGEAVSAALAQAVMGGGAQVPAARSLQ
nr:hypothetical protein [Acidithiobacillus sp.]